MMRMGSAVDLSTSKRNFTWVTSSSGYLRHSEQLRRYRTKGKRSSFSNKGEIMLLRVPLPLN
jgi:hypothetical protein